LGAIGVSPLQAQDYPSRPIKIIVPFSPGGAVDGPTRIIGDGAPAAVLASDDVRKFVIGEEANRAAA